MMHSKGLVEIDREDRNMYLDLIIRSLELLAVKREDLNIAETEQAAMPKGERPCLSD